MKIFILLFTLFLSPLSSNPSGKDCEKKACSSKCCKCTNCKCTSENHCGCKSRCKVCSNSTKQSCPFGKSLSEEKEENIFKNLELTQP